VSSKIIATSSESWLTNKVLRSSYISSKKYSMMSDLDFSFFFPQPTWLPLKRFFSQRPMQGCAWMLKQRSPGRTNSSPTSTSLRYFVTIQAWARSARHFLPIPTKLQGSTPFEQTGAQVDIKARTPKSRFYQIVNQTIG